MGIIRITKTVGARFSRKYLLILVAGLVLLEWRCNETLPPSDEEPRWYFYESPIDGDWYGADYFDEESVWVCGVRENENGIIIEFDGVSFKVRVPPVGTSELRGCCVQAKNAVWFVGIDDSIYLWDGSKFNVWSSPTNNLNAIDMATATFGFAVGDNGAILEFDGLGWRQVDSPATYNLNSIEFVSMTEAWAVGDKGTLLHYVSGNWTEYPPVTDADLNDISFINAYEGWLVGSQGTVYRYDGSSWMPYSVPNPGSNLYCVAFPAAEKGWAGGDKTTLLVFEDGAWAKEKDLPTGPWELRDITAPGKDEAWAVGDNIILYYK